ncbi:hypothetical protein COU58_03495 [Candidatus Pacearchaeota archaeon CG10_big_fil_rev_8_21_14_0_10_32_42]|nr:MAG: hypothetical protein COU58_03495 [Candidatus Pacearchaeota archaeon CG10_big_fil_rev_8_21_14_0_10_32_42]
MTQQTQIKQISKGWKEIPLNEVLDYEQPNGYIIKSKIKENGKTPVLTANKSFIKGYVDESDNIYSKIPTIIFDDFTADNKFVNFPFKVKSSAMKILNLKEDVEFDLRFVFYQMQIQKVNTTTHKRYYLSKYQNLKFSFPSLPEQTLIVQEIEKQFTRLDAAVKSLKSVKQKLEVYRKAVLNKSFYGDKKTFPEIISKEKHSMKRGPFGGSLKKEIFVPSGFLVYEQYHPINNDFDFGRYFITKEKFEEMKAFFVKPGDLLISCSGTIGKIAEIPEENFKEGIINQALLKITLDNSKVLNKYFIYLFQSQYIQKHLTKISRGVAIKNVPSVKELKTIEFPIPSIQEQQVILQNIESKFSVIDKIEQVVNESLKKSEKLRKSILKSAFGGKLVKIEEVKE